VIAFNEAHRELEMPHFGQEFFLAAQAKDGLESEAYRSALAACREIARDGLDAAFARHRLDALVAPTAGVAGPVDLARGDVHVGSVSAPPAVAGTPHLTVPMGFVGALPAGFSFIGPAWADAQVLRFGYAYEQATRAWRAPTPTSGD
jgi:amidase